MVTVQVLGCELSLGPEEVRTVHSPSLEILHCVDQAAAGFREFSIAQGARDVIQERDI